MTAETRNSKLETGSSAVVEEQSSIDNRQSKIAVPLLLEVGCEEIPARFLHDAEKGLGERVQAALRKARLLPEAAVGTVGGPRLRTYSTPRRLVVHVLALAGRQPDKVEEILGPPVKVAVDAEGKYTRAAESFAQKNSAGLQDLTRTATPKGEYLALRKITQGRSAQDILSEILPETILGLSFPKSVYWMEKSGPRFVRPIRWVLAILGEGKRAAPIEFEILGVKPCSVSVSEADSVSDVERMRQSFRPRRISTLFVGESPPEGGTFFYKGNGLLHDNMKEAFGEGANFLSEFKAKGFFLDDVVLYPINRMGDAERNMHRRKGVPLLARRMADYRPAAVVVLMCAIKPMVEDAIREAGLSLVPYVAPFPNHWHKKSFKEKMDEIIPKLPVAEQPGSESAPAAASLGLNHPLSFGGFTFGHRTKGHEPLLVSSFKDYAKKLEKANVEIDYTRRHQRVVHEGKAVLGETSGKIVEDEQLVDWIANSTEWPRPILGSFDSRFLHLPREILIAVMRNHQKYFAVEDGRGNLRPHFVAVLNMDSDEKGLIREGHERVLRARLTDAEFFWNADQRIPLRDRLPLLEKVTYQAKLGSYADKVKRMRKVGESLRSVLETNDRSLARYTVAIQDAISLCKCDLTTEMVQEFPELQGVVGGLYAAAQGEPPEIAKAIYDHYLPQGADDRCPATLVGAIVSLADKLDSVVGALAVDLEPTGSSDPFALRRQGNGIIKVVLEFKLPISLPLIVGRALETLDITWRRPSEEVSGQVLEFLADRLRYYLEAACSFRYDTVRAVLASGSDVPYEAFLRAQALHNLRGSENLEALCVAAKRIKNILEKSASLSDWSPGEVDESLLTEDAERELYRAYLALDRDTQALARVGDYQLALEAISTLRPSVDTFFDKVLVMAENPAVRENRLRLLGKLDRMFSGIARFAEIAAEAETE